ncbi:MAG: VWA domain-containing protein [bacterium]|nr:VWA domain-containing protein [bacterium]
MISPLASRLARSVAALAVLLIAPHLGAEEDPAPRTSFIERLEVNVVNVEVFVTDKKGRPVTGLTAEDFEVLEDGKRVELTHFAAPAPAPATLAVPAPAPAPDAPAEVSAPEEPDETPPQQNHMVLFVDNFNIKPHNRQRVLGEVREFLDEALDPDTKIMVASYDGHVNVRQVFTADNALLHAALDSMGKLSGQALAHQAERNSLLREAQQVLEMIRMVNQAPNPTSFAEAADLGSLAKMTEETFSSLVQQVDSTSQRLHLNNRAAVQAMAHFVGALASLPGRKALVYVSDGVPMRPGEDLFWAMDETFQQGRRLRFRDRSPGGDAGGQGGGDAGGQGGGSDDDGGFNSSEIKNIVSYRTRSQRHSLAHYFESLTAVANTHQVSFYTIDARGGAGRLPDASIEGRMGAVYSSGLRGIQDANLWETLDVMSRKTGGVTLTGGDVQGLLQQATGDFSSYYSLGYTPPHSGDGERHKIKVKLKRRGLKTRYRQSYLDKPLTGKVADRTAAALFLELGDNPHGLFVETLAASPGEKRGQYSVPMLVKVPLASVALLPRGEVHACDAKLYITSLDARGAAGAVQEVAFSIEIPNADLGKIQGQYYTARMEMVLRQGSQKIAVGFWDEAAALGSFVSHELSVGEVPANES